MKKLVLWRNHWHKRMGCVFLNLVNKSVFDGLTDTNAVWRWTPQCVHYSTLIPASTDTRTKSYRPLRLSFTPHPDVKRVPSDKTKPNAFKPHLIIGRLQQCLNCLSYLAKLNLIQLHLIKASFQQCLHRWIYFARTQLLRVGCRTVSHAIRNTPTSEQQHRFMSRMFTLKPRGSVAWIAMRTVLSKAASRF